MKALEGVKTNNYLESSAEKKGGQALKKRGGRQVVMKAALRKQGETSEKKVRE